LHIIRCYNNVANRKVTSTYDNEYNFSISCDEQDSLDYNGYKLYRLVLDNPQNISPGARIPEGTFVENHCSKM